MLSLVMVALYQHHQVVRYRRAEYKTSKTDYLRCGILDLWISVWFPVKCRHILIFPIL